MTASECEVDIYMVYSCIKKYLNSLFLIFLGGVNKLTTLRELLHNLERLPSVIYKRLMVPFFKVESTWVLYESFLGRGYSDNPKYIFEYLEAKYPGKFVHIWSFSQPGKMLPARIIQVKRGGLRQLFYLAKSRYIVTNMRQPSWFIKKDGQIFLETWHGTPLKKLVFDVEDNEYSNSEYKAEFCRQAQQWDFLISPNEYSTAIFRRAFRYSNNIIESGYPRNDLLYSPGKKLKIADKVRKELALPQDKKIILYAPTWREDEFSAAGERNTNPPLNINLLKQRLGSEYVLLVRTHYLIKEQLKLELHRDFVIDVSSYDDIAEIYLAADVLVTDYSSVIFDFINLKKTIIFYMYDYDKYRNELRGFYLNPETELPGPVVTKTDQLADKLSRLDDVYLIYKERIEEFYNRFCGWEVGRSSEKVCKIVFDV
ncbi:CDP-glycerol glycerophosphotransferase family protein [Microbulbifer sp. TRSA002]|uniref:CDP-glycerol glycerophosphotransferase family protein n=1 Tax=Microbulbifer sp. TRSA002 TaxID=3243382 RepID=UPI004039C2C3